MSSIGEEKENNKSKEVDWGSLCGGDLNRDLKKVKDGTGVVHASNPSTHGAQTVRATVPGQFGLQSELQDNQSYSEKPCLKNNNKKKTHKTLNPPQTNKQTIKDLFQKL